MATSMNSYERLYINLKNRFTVVNGAQECSLGEYMLIKAGKNNDTSVLPVETTMHQPLAVVSFVNFISDKLMVKEAPHKDKVMRAFPLRSAAAAMLSALLVCTFVITYSATNLNIAENDNTPEYMAASEDAEIEEREQKSELR